jgi:hypothetical protein
MALRAAIFLPSRMKKRKYNPACVEDEVSLSDMLSEELDIVSGDEMNWKMKGKVQAKNRATHHQKVSVRVKQVLHVLMGGKTLGWATRNSTHTHLLKMQGHNFTFYHIQSLWIISVYFSVTSF